MKKQGKGRKTAVFGAFLRKIMGQAVGRVCFIGIIFLNENYLQTFALYEKKTFLLPLRGNTETKMRFGSG